MTNEPDGRSDYSRVDAAIIDWQATEEDCVYADFARQLVREIADERARAEGYAKALERIAEYPATPDRELSCKGLRIFARQALSRPEPKGETNAGATQIASQLGQGVTHDKRSADNAPVTGDCSSDAAPSPAPTMQPAYDHGIDRGFMDALERGDHLKWMEGDPSPAPDAMPADAPTWTVGNMGLGDVVERSDYDALRRHAEGLAEKLSLMSGVALFNRGEAERNHERADAAEARAKELERWLKECRNFLSYPIDPRVLPPQLLVVEIDKALAHGGAKNGT